MLRAGTISSEGVGVNQHMKHLREEWLRTLITVLPKCVI